MVISLQLLISQESFCYIKLISYNGGKVKM
jgi:hypothetical protein